LLLGFFACCLLAAAPGCAFHRTEHGFVLRSGHWTLERNREDPDSRPQVAAEKPELLPWRNRLKGYRLGSRIFPGRQSAGEAQASETASGDLELPDSEARRSEPNRPDLVVE
jgi:hypothetical protein